MDLTEHEVVARVERLTATRLRTWVTTGCVRPRKRAGKATFSETDVARLELLCALSDDLEIGEEAVPIVLSLIDQIHGLRGMLRNLARAVDEQPKTVRDAIARALDNG